MVDSISSVSEAKPDGIIYNRPVLGIILAVLIPAFANVIGIAFGFLFPWVCFGIRNYFAKG